MFRGKENFGKDIANTRKPTLVMHLKRKMAATQHIVCQMVGQTLQPAHRLNGYTAKSSLKMNRSSI